MSMTIYVTEPRETGNKEYCWRIGIMVRHAGAVLFSFALAATAYAQGVDQKRIDLSRFSGSGG